MSDGIPVDNAPSLGVRIDTMFAYVSDDGDGEGVIAVPMGGAMMPLVGADEERMQSLRPFAEAVALAAPERQVRLIRFDTRTDVEVIQPTDGSRRT